MGRGPRRIRLFRRVRPVQTACLLALLVACKIYTQEGRLETVDTYLLLLPLCVFLVYLIRAAYYRLQCSEFGRYPERFDRKSIELSGTIVYVFPDTFFEKAKRKTVDAVRTAQGSDDYRGRYIHQRFLIRAKGTFPSKAILIEHNVSYGKHSIKKGGRVSVKGEYIHSTKAHHFYGRLHKTHEPHGFLSVLP